MTFLWPSMLLSLLLVPVLAGLYIVFLQRRQKQRSRLLGLAALQPGPSGGNSSTRPGFRRHVPPAFFLTSLAVLSLALARPQATLNLPRVEGTVMLVFDVSGSMAAEDASPTRLEAAKAAAREFVTHQPATVQVGVVAFSAAGFAVQAPTDDVPALMSAIDRLKPQTGTSLGQGIVAALSAIAVDSGAAPPQPDSSASPGSSPASGDGQQPLSSEQSALAQLPEGPFPSAVIILLSDGENNMTRDPQAAAQAALDRSVRINTIGFGSPAGTNLQLDGFSVHTSLEEATLQQIAALTGGKYVHAQGDQSQDVISADIMPQLVVKPEAFEITSVLAGVSILILMLGGAFSLVWFGRLP